MTDLRLQFEGRLDKKEIDIAQLTEENIRLKDNIKGQDEAIGALS